MKYRIPLRVLMVILFAIPFVSLSQVRKIPASVTEAFKQKYQQAANVEWKDRLSGYAAVFELNGEKLEARFNNDAEWQSTNKEIEESELPAVVNESYEKSKYAEWEIGSIHRIELPDDKIQFRVQAIKNEIRKKNLLFSSDGKLLKDNIAL